MKARRRKPAPVKTVAGRGASVVLLALVGLLASACGTTTEDPATPQPPSEVRVYFVGGGMDPCGEVGPVVREVEGSVDAEVALRELLRGPTEEETAAGFTSLFGPATADALQGVVVADGIARVSFADLRPLVPNASSSCGSAALLAALDSTLAQVPGIRGARYSFGGDEAAFYEWLQMAPPD